MNLPEITEVQRLALKPGDRIVIRTEDAMTAERAHMIRERLRGWLPDGVQILILDPGMTLEVLEPPGDREISR